jgi:hypothetical protein
VTFGLDGGAPLRRGGQEALVVRQRLALFALQAERLAEVEEQPGERSQRVGGLVLGDGAS